jgi:hypothetical protein
VNLSNLGVVTEQRVSSDDAKEGELSEGEWGLEWGAAPKLGRALGGCDDRTIGQRKIRVVGDYLRRSEALLGAAFVLAFVPASIVDERHPAGARPPVEPQKQLSSLQRPLTKSCASAPARCGCRFIFGVQGFQSAQKATCNCVLLLVLSFALPSRPLVSHSTEKTRTCLLEFRELRSDELPSPGSAMALQPNHFNQKNQPIK